MNFETKTYKNLKRRLDLKYKRELRKLKNEVNHINLNLSTWFKNHSKELISYSEINWHFLQQVNQYLFLKKYSDLLNNNVFGETEDLVFEKWNNSEFADYFLKTLNKKGGFKTSALKTLNVFEKHLVSLGNRHILNKSKISKLYRIQPSLGEFEKNKKIHRAIETNINFEKISIRLLTKTLKEASVFSPRIKSALELIKKFSPSSWERFQFFTRAIVPIDNVEFVSFSHQDLPGFSMINLYHRDFIDLLDDLIHENGHHHLNYYLNTSKLIQSSPETIYYSPWRKTLRPLRGIYHAYFTFFWGFQLFFDLSRGISSLEEHPFSARDKEKIIWRMIEEYHMLNFCFEDLTSAYLQGLIYPQGWQLIEEQQKILESSKKHVKKFENKLKFYRKEFVKLKLTLKAAREKFRA